MTLNPYLFFDGQCADAFDFYKSVFGGEFTDRMAFADGPPEMGVPDAEKSRIMHVSLPIGGNTLMGADTVSIFGAPATPANSIAISFQPATREEADNIFPLLAADGEITMPLQVTFWNAYFGTLTDKFGVRWMVNVTLGEQ